MKLVAYTRVSTNGQVDAFGLPAQRQAIAAWAKLHGHEIVAHAEDAGVSGRLLERPGLGEALAIVRDGEAQGVVVARLDRLARDTVVQETLFREVWGMGAEVLSTAERENDLRDDPDDPSRKLIRTILSAVATYERELITLRMMQGRRAKKRHGGKGEGAYPFGFDRAGPVEREQAVLAKVRELRGGGASWPKVAVALNALPEHQPRLAAAWTAATTAHLGRKADIA